MLRFHSASKRVVTFSKIRGFLGGLGLLAVIVFGSGARVYSQSSTFTSNVVTGNWNTPGSWTEVGSDVDDIPDADDIVIILSGHNITVNVVSAAQNTTINSGGTLTVSNSFSTAGLVVNGTYIHNIDGGIVPSGVWAATSNFEVRGVTNASPSNLNQSFGNFIWDCAGQATNIYLESNISIQNDFVVNNAGGVLDHINRALRMSNTTSGYTIAVGRDVVINSQGAFKMNNNTGSCVMTVGRNLLINGGNFTIVTGGANSTVTVTGDVNISGGTLRMHEDGSATVGTLNVNGNFSHTGGLIDEDNIGSGLIVFAGVGTQTFTSGGTITNTIDFQVNSGVILQMADPTTTVTGGGSFSLSSGATLGIRAAGGISATGASGHVQVTGTRAFNTGASYIYNGSGAQITGSGLPTVVQNLTIANTGPNIVTLTNSLTSVAAALTVSNGTLALGGNSIGDIGSLSMTGTSITGTGTLTLDGDVTFNVSPVSAAISANVALGPAVRTFTVADGPSVVDAIISGTISGDGISKAGNGLLNLSGGNSYTGLTAINTGTLQLGSSSALGTTAGATVIALGAVLDLNGVNYTSAEPLTINGTGISSNGALINSNTSTATFSGLVTLGSASSIVGGTGAINLSHVGTITGGFDLTLGGASGGTLASVVGTGAASLIKTDAGIWTLSGANTYTGATNVAAGTLRLGASDRIADASALQISGTFDLNGFSEVVGSIAGAGTVRSSSTGAITLTAGGDNSSTTFSGLVENGSATSMSLVKNGTGALTLSGSNTFTGGLTLNAGTLNINSAVALGTGTFIYAGGSIDNTSGGSLLLTANNPQNWNADVVFIGTHALNMGTGAVTPNANRVVTVNGSLLTVGGVIGGGAISISKAGAAQLTLSGANTFSGGFNLNAGRVNVNNAQALGASTGTLSINGGGLDNTTGAAITLVNYPQVWNGDFSFAGSRNLNLGNGTVVLSANRNVSVNGGVLTVGGIVSSPTFNLTKAGIGELSFGGNNVSVNDLTISAGTLRAPTSTLNLSGNFVSNGVFVNNTGTVHFLGSGTQSVPSVSYHNLSLSGSGQKNAAGNINIASNLINAAVFDLGANSLSVTGSIDNTGGTLRFSGSTNALAVPTGTVEYYGASQTVASGSYRNLTINQSSGDASQVGNVQVDDVLTINSGRLNLQNHVLTIGVGGTISISPSAARMIIATGGGEVRKAVSGDGSFLFPIGDNTGAFDYSPVTVNFTGSGYTSAYVSASVTDAKHPSNASPTHFLSRYWSILTSGIASSSISVSGTYVGADVVGAVGQISAAAAINPPVNPWQKFGLVGGTVATTSIAVTDGEPTFFTGVTSGNPTAAAGSDVSICTGGTVILGGSPTATGGVGGYTYSWSPSSGLSATSVANPVLTGVSSGVTNYTVTVTDANGAVATAVVQVTVDPIPAVTNGTLTQSICGSGTASFTPVISVGGSTYTWSSTVLSGSVSGVTAGGTNVPVSDNLTNSGSVAAVVRYRVSPTGSAPSLCAGNFVDYVVTVNPLPIVSVSPNQELCAGSATAASIFSGVGSFTWTNDNPSIGLPATGVGDVPSFTAINSANSPVTATITVNASIAGCPPATQTFFITVNPNPSFTITNATAEICSGTPVDILFNSSTSGHRINVVSVAYGAVTGGTVTGSSTFTNGDRITDVLQNNTNAPIDVVYTFNVTTPFTTPVCPLTPLEQTTTVRVLPAPQFSLTNTTANQICSGSSTDILLNTPVSGGRVRLVSVNYGAATGSLTSGTLYTDGQRIQETIINSTNNPVTVSYTFEAVVGTCTPGAPQTTSVLVNPNPSFSITNSTAEICSGTPVDILFNSSTAGHRVNVVSVNYGAVTGGTVTLATTFTDADRITETLTNTTNAPIDVVYVFNVTTPLTTPPCALAPVNQTTTVRVLPAPQFTLTNTTANQICSGSSTDILLNTPVSGGRVRLVSVNYGAASGSLTSGTLYTNGQRIQETIINSTNNPVTVSYTFEAVVGTCAPSVQQSTSVLVNPNPQFSFVNATGIICSGSPTDILFNSATAGHRINVVSVVYGAVTGGTVIPGTTTFVNGSRLTETLVNATNAPQDVTYVFNVTTPFTSPVCPASPVNQTAVIRVNPIPNVSFAGATTICSNTTTDLQLNNPNGVAGTTFTWSVTATNVTGAFDGAGNRINQALSSTDGNTPGTVTYTVVPAANACSGAPLIINVVVNPVPTLATSLPSQDLCNGQTSTIALSNPNSVAGVGYVWTVSTTGISGVSNQATAVPAGAFNVPISLITPSVGGTANFSVRAVANNCFSVPATVGLTIRPLPTLTVPANTVLCEPTSILLPGTVGQSADRGLWSIVTGAGALSATNIVTGSPIQVSASYDVDPADIGTTIVMRLTTSDPDGPTGLCEAASADYSIAVNRSARLTAGPDITICADVASTPLQGAITFAPNGVAWSLVTGTGTFSNPASATSNYAFNNPAEINQTVTLRLTGFDPDGSGPCANVFDEMNFRVNPLPVVSFVGLPPGTPPQVAENIAPFPLTGNQVGGVFTVQPVTSNIGATIPSPTDRAFFDPNNAELGSNQITYTFTNANGCTNSTTQELIVNPVTVVDFAVQGATLNGSGQFELCAEQGQVRLLGFPAASTGLPPETQFKSIPAFPGGPTATIVFNGTDYFIETNGLASNTYRIQYDYKNAFGAITFRIRDIVIFASPVAAFTSLNNCIASDVVFNDTSTINPTPFSTSIVNWLWTFGDPGDISSVQNPSKRFVTSGTKNITLRVTTLQGCSNTSAIFPLRVGDVPEPDFESSAFCNNDQTLFRDRTRKVFPADPAALSTIAQFTWDFGDGNTMTGNSNSTVPVGTHGGATSGTFNDPQHQYTTFGTYNVRQTVRTNDGCINTVVKRIFILPYNTVRPVADSAYYQDFNTTNGGWVAEAFESRISPTRFTLSPGYIASDTSWIWGIPGGAVIRGTDRAWWTGANSNQYYPNENSVVNGPCFDLRQLQRPMVSMDVWTDAERNIDGAVLQYSSDGGITWRIVGPAESLFGPDRDQGINWFNGTFITSNPGSQTIGQFGWTNATQNSRQSRWLNARFNLDMIPVAERAQVRLRIAFASNDKNAADAVGSRFDGFAFDNVYVGGKKRQVLVEHFTNFTATPSQAILDAASYLNTLYQDQITFRQGNPDFTDIQYHMELPGTDVLNQENPTDPASRALFMNVSQPPTTIMDGIINSQFNGLTTRLNRVELDRRALKDPLFRLQLQEVPATDNNRISVRVTVTADSAVNTFPMIVQVALLEDGIGSGRSTFRRFLLGPGGQIINGSWVRNQQRIVTRDTAAIDVPIKDANRLRLVAFIQNRNTREILQVTSITATPKQGRLVVGLEDNEIARSLQNISVYPNPAKGTFFLQVPEELIGRGEWKLLDQRGVSVRTGKFQDAKNGVIQVAVGDLPESIYIVALTGPNNTFIYKKIMLLRER